MIYISNEQIKKPSIFVSEVGTARSTNDPSRKARILGLALSRYKSQGEEVPRDHVAVTHVRIYPRVIAVRTINNKGERKMALDM